MRSTRPHIDSSRNIYWINEAYIPVRRPVTDSIRILYNTSEELLITTPTITYNTVDLNPNQFIRWKNINELFGDFIKVQRTSIEIEIAIVIDSSCWLEFPLVCINW